MFAFVLHASLSQTTAAAIPQSQGACSGQHQTLPGRPLEPVERPLCCDSCSPPAARRGRPPTLMRASPPTTPITTLISHIAGFCNRCTALNREPSKTSILHSLLCSGIEMNSQSFPAACRTHLHLCRIFVSAVTEASARKRHPQAEIAVCLAE